MEERGYRDAEYAGKVLGMKTLKQLIAEKKIIPASGLAKHKEDAERLAKDLEEAVRSEISHRRTKLTTAPDTTIFHYTREPFEE